MNATEAGRSEPDRCPICLDPPKGEAYLDRCFHSFCCDCIVQWSKFIKEKFSPSILSIKCPLCKVENFSIVHSFDGKSFQRYYVNGDTQTSFLTSGHWLRSQCYNIDTGSLFNVEHYWKFHRYRQRNIWLQTWLRREIQTLTQEEDVGIIVHHLDGVIQAIFRRNDDCYMKITPDERRKGFRALLSDAACRFLGGRTERFIDELELFLASGLNIEAYDRVYMHHLEMRSSSEESS